MSRFVRMGMVIAGGLACVGCDQSTKILAVRWLSGTGPMSFLGDTFRFHYVENRGAFLSLGSSLSPELRTGLFVVLVAGMLAALLAYAVAAKRITAVELLATTLIVGGGAGNLIDRIRYGYVRDFANMGIGPLRTGVFNVADVVIFAGFLLLLFHVAASSRARSER